MFRVTRNQITKKYRIERLCYMHRFSKWVEEPGEFDAQRLAESEMRSLANRAAIDAAWYPVHGGRTRLARFFDCLFSPIDDGGIM